MSVRVVSDIQPLLRLMFVYLIQHGRSCCIYYIHVIYMILEYLSKHFQPPDRESVWRNQKATRPISLPGLRKIENFSTSTHVTSIYSNLTYILQQIIQI